MRSRPKAGLAANNARRQFPHLSRPSYLVAFGAGEAGYGGRSKRKSLESTLLRRRGCRSRALSKDATNGTQTGRSSALNCKSICLFLFLSVFNYLASTMPLYMCICLFFLLFRFISLSISFHYSRSLLTYGVGRG